MDQRKQNTKPPSLFMYIFFVIKDWEEKEERSLLGDL